VTTGTHTVSAGGVDYSNLRIGGMFLSTLVEGGFTLDGTPTITPAEAVAVTVVDTTPSINDGDVQVCGYVDAAAQTAQSKTCETLDFSGGGATLTTTATFVEVTNIKASSFAVLGGGGDETIAAAFDPSTQAILAAVDLTNSAKSDFDPTNAPSANFSKLSCLDLQGCDLSLDAPTLDGHELTLVVLDGSTAITFVETANMKVSAAHALDGFDTIRFISSLDDAAYLEVSVAVN
jgi:hypothetical protein